MDTKQVISKLEEQYLPLDKSHVLRTRNIKKIPRIENRRGGKLAYSEWAHVIGLFQTLIFTHLEKMTGNKILDIGCGTGLLGIASEPYVKIGGKYIGIDVSAQDINFCKSYYLDDYYDFIKIDAHNYSYNPGTNAKHPNWPIADDSIDLLTAVSVWTHFNEEDSRSYMLEVDRVLKKGSYAIITCFHKDDVYKDGLELRTNSISSFHATNPKAWTFETPAYGSSDWFCRDDVKVPEEAIAITTEGIQSLFSGTSLSLLAIHPGNWKEVPGLFFQDIMIIKKISNSNE